MLQLGNLETSTRRGIDMLIGQGIYGVLTDGRAQAAIEAIPEDADPFLAERYVHMVVLSAAHPDQPLWRTVLPPVVQGQLNTEAPQDNTSFSMASEHILERLQLTSVEQPELAQLMDGLIIEAFEDSLFWTDVIKRTEGLPADLADLSGHPTILAATSLNHTVHSVVKGVMKQRLLADVQPVVPRSKADFIGLYQLAPKLLGFLGLKLEVETGETRLSEKSGFCPAKARDCALDQSWLDALQKISGKFYSKFFLDRDYIC